MRKKLFKKYINKKNFKLLKNVELICIINPSLIDDYRIFLKNKLTSKKENQQFKFLDKNWFSKNNGFLNYYEIFSKENMKDIIPHFFFH